MTSHKEITQIKFKKSFKYLNYTLMKIFMTYFDRVFLYMVILKEKKNTQ